jgi:hypothetical protein
MARQRVVDSQGFLDPEDVIGRLHHITGFDPPLPVQPNALL